MFGLLQIFPYIVILLRVLYTYYAGWGEVEPEVEDFNKWRHDLFINLDNTGSGFRCEYVRNKVFKRAGVTVMEHKWSYSINDTSFHSSAVGEQVEDNTYTFDAVQNGNTKIFYAKFLHFDPPDLVIVHIVDNSLESGEGRLSIQSGSPTPPKDKACLIKKIVEDNEMTLDYLEVIDNCQCRNGIPSPRAKCNLPTSREYFQHC